MKKSPDYLAGFSDGSEKVSEITAQLMTADSCNGCMNYPISIKKCSGCKRFYPDLHVTQKTKRKTA